jgi:hypothetical protein
MNENDELLILNVEYTNETACGFAMITEKAGSKLPTPY